MGSKNIVEHFSDVPDPREDNSSHRLIDIIAGRHLRVDLRCSYVERHRTVRPRETAVVGGVPRIATRYSRD